MSCILKSLFDIPSGVRVILASGSPRRRALLTEIGWSFDVVLPDVDETPKTGETPQALCLRLAESKVLSVACRYKNALVIGADTIVLIDGAALGKPIDKADAIRMLSLLQGRTHEVLTGYALVWDGRARSRVEKTAVRFRPLGHDDIQSYVDTKEGLDKAGAYAIQGKGSLLVAGIDGDYFNVVGLPLCSLRMMIEEWEV
ncbi:Maf-like protein [Synergistales bacterium]|nr:Maf-like protein [Synergistales bacterium]